MYADRRRDRLAEPLRPLLLELLAAEEPGRVDVAVLSRLEPRQWAVLEPTVVSLLGKVRGETRDLLVSLLDERGVLADAARRAHGRMSVTRARAAQLLGASRRPGSVAPLARLLTDRDPDVRNVAARALGALGAAAAAGPLLEAAARRDAVPPRVLAHSLVQLEAGAEPRLIEATADRDPAVRGLVVEILGLRQSVRAHEAVITLLRDDPELEVRIRAARAAGRIGMPGSLTALADAVAADQPTPLRAVATGALGDLGAVAAVPILADLLGDGTHRVAANAARALAKLGPAGLDALRAAADGGANAGAHARAVLALEAERRRGGDGRAA